MSASESDNVEEFVRTLERLEAGAEEQRQEMKALRAGELKARALVPDLQRTVDALRQEVLYLQSQIAVPELEARARFETVLDLYADVTEVSLVEHEQFKALYRYIGRLKADFEAAAIDGDARLVEEVKGFLTETDDVERELASRDSVEKLMALGVDVNNGVLESLADVELWKPPPNSVALQRKVEENLASQFVRLNTQLDETKQYLDTVLTPLQKQRVNEITRATETAMQVKLKLGNVFFNGFVHELVREARAADAV
jgi:hypothetical protein